MCSLAEFGDVLKNVANPDNGIRAQAETFLQSAKQNPNWLVPALLEVARTSQDAVVSHISVVMLRRYVSRTSDGLFDKLDASTQVQVRTTLLGSIAEPRSPPILKGLAHCVSGLGCQLLTSGWPELIPELFNIIKNGDVAAQCASLMIFTALAPHFEDSMMASHAPAMREMCTFALQHNDIAVKIQAVELVMEVVTYIKDASLLKAFQQLLPLLIAAIGQALTEAKWIEAERGVQCFIALAEVSPEFFQAHLKEVFAPFLEITSSGALDPNLRRLAFEFTITLAETDPKAVRKVPQYLSSSVPLAMQLQLTLDHEEDWATTPEADDDEATNFDFGVEALDRLAVALGGKKMHPVVSPLVMEYLQSADWKHRHAGLWSLSQVAEGCAKEFKPLLKQIVPLVSKGFEDPHERVRHAAITCMAQFCTEFSPSFQANYHGVFLPLLMQRMTDVPRVASLAAQSCINFMEGAEREDTSPYLDALLTSMLQLLQSSPHRFVSESVVSAITAIASHAEGLFEKYYSTITPWLKTVIMAPQVARADRMLRAKALECLSRVALAVGKQRFAPDAPEVLEAMKHMQTSTLEADDPMCAYLMRSWGRMAECLGPDMGQYYQTVMPALITQVSTQTDVQITDEEGQETEDGVQTLTLALKGLGEKRISIKTSALEEKTLACAVLSQVLEAGHSVLLPFVETLVPVLTPLLRFAYVEDVREDAAGCMPSLVKCVQANASVTPGMVQQLVHHVVPSLLEAIQTEPNSTVKAAQLAALSACLEAAPADCLGEHHVGKIVELVQKMLADGAAAREKLKVEKRACEDEEDEDQWDAQMEAEEEAMCQAVDVTTTLLKTEAAFLPHFERTFFPQYTALIGKGLFETRLGLCAAASFVEHHAHGAAGPQIPAIAEALLSHCDPQGADPDVVQVACYGLGEGCACGAPFAAFAPAAVQRLGAVLTARAADEEWESVVCNVCSALLKAHQAGAEAAVEALLPAVLAALPMRGDEEEGQYVHERVTALLEAGHPVVSANREAVACMARSVRGTSFLTDTVDARLKALQL